MPTATLPKWKARLPNIQCPTLVVFGQEDRSVIPDAASIYRERIPNCNVAFVYAAGHDIAADRPQALVNLHRPKPYPTTSNAAKRS